MAIGDCMVRVWRSGFDGLFFNDFELKDIGVGEWVAVRDHGLDGVPGDQLDTTSSLHGSDLAEKLTVIPDLNQDLTGSNGVFG
jgi:hypothetical protein